MIRTCIYLSMAQVYMGNVRLYVCFQRLADAHVGLAELTTCKLINSRDHFDLISNAVISSDPLIQVHVFEGMSQSPSHCVCYEPKSTYCGTVFDRSGVTVPEIAIIRI